MTTKPLSGSGRIAVALAWLVRIAAVVLALAALPAHAASCSMATSQGTSGPANWQTYCWIDFSTYNDTAARGAGQTMTLTLQDGTTLSFKLAVSGATIGAVAVPSWSGAAVGNSAFLGIAGSPVMYQTAAGTTTVTISNIVMTPPAGASGVTQYMFVAADGESTNTGESLAFQTNGGAWAQLDASGPISGTTYPTVTGTGTTNVSMTSSTAGNVGAYVFGSTTPTTVTTTLLGGGLQGAMFAVRYASIRLTTQIVGARAVSADQFAFAINSTTSGGALASGASSGTTLGPFTSAALSTSAAVPLTLVQAMAAGSTDTISHYQSKLTCTNSTTSSTALPSAVVTTSYAMPQLSFGDNIQCTYTETPFPHLQLTKALGSNRQFTADQFTMQISQGGSVVATTTTTGTGSTVTNGATAMTQVTAGTAATLGEVGAGVTSLTQYTSAMACTNANSGSATTLPATPGGAITPALGDVVSCTLTNTKVAANANLTIVKSSAVLSDPVNGSTNARSIPGSIMLYTLTVANTGTRAVDSNSVFIVDTLPGQLSVGTAANPAFTQGSPTSGLTFTAGTDIKYSNAATAPTTFAGCTYTPVSSYDPAVKFVCLNPKGTFAGSSGTPPSFQISLQAKLN